MRSSYIAFRNLRAEMSRNGIGVVEMARQLGWNRDTLARKLANRARLNLDEAFVIQQTFFPDLEVQYLFEESAQSNAG